MNSQPCAGYAPACPGFTLTELTIVLAIVAISSTLIIPSFNYLVSYNTSASSSNQISGMIKYARNIAVTHSTNTTLCPSIDGMSCTKTAWQDGIILFQDKDADGLIDKEDKVERFVRPFLDKGTLRWRSLRNKVQFNSRGAARGTTGSFVYCPENKDEKMGASLILSLQGRLRKGPDSNSDGIPESGSHKNISC